MIYQHKKYKLNVDFLIKITSIRSQFSFYVLCLFCKAGVTLNTSCINTCKCTFSLTNLKQLKLSLKFILLLKFVVAYNVYSIQLGF